MSKNLMRNIIIFLALGIVLLFSLNTGFAAGNTYNITSNMNTSDVQSVINNATAGDTLDFVNQTYSLNQLNVNKSLNIVSKVNSIINRNSTTVIQSSSLFSVTASDVLISGFRINNHLIGVSSQGTSANNLKIINNTFTNCGQAIIIRTNNSLIEDNYIGNKNSSFAQINFPMGQYYQYAIVIWEGGPGGAIIRNNTITGTGWTYAIVNYAPNALITKNNVTGIGGAPISVPILGISIIHAAIATTLNGHGTNITYNLIDSNGGFGIRNDCDNVIIANNAVINNRGYGIYNMNSHSTHLISEGGNLVNIQNNTVESTRSATGFDGTGIYNQGIDANITNNTVKNNVGDGIRNSGSNTTILNNTVFSNSYHGINVATAGNNTTVSKNTVYNQTGTNRAGIYFAGSVGLVFDNNVYGNRNGIQLLSSLIRLNNNTIINNNQSGLILAFSNANLNIFNNTFKYNGVAINITGSNNILGDFDDTGIYNEITENTNGVLVNGVGNKVSHLNVYNNLATAFIVLRNNNTITGCNVFDNNLGFNLTGNGTKINYNRILNNTLSGLYNYGNNNDFTSNWWGQNNISDQYKVISGSNYNISNWFVMELSAESYNTIVNATINRTVGLYNMTYKFLLYNNITQISEFVSYENLPDFLVNLTWKNKNGNIINTILNVNAKSEHSYIINLIRNANFTLESIGDNENFKLSILAENYVADVNLVINKTVDQINNLSKGQIITYIISVKNDGLEDAYNVIVSELLSNKLILLNSSSSIGFWNSVSGLWEIGILNSGETAFLEILVQINGTGIINNQIHLTTDDNNLANNDSNVTINVPKIPTNITIEVPENVYVGDSTIIKSKLTDKDGNPISNATVDFYLNGTKIGSAVTDKDGIATLNYTFKKMGIYNFTAKFDGDDTYLPSSATNKTKALKIKTSLDINVKGDSVTITLNDEFGNLLTNKKITVMIGDSLIYGVTDENGQFIFTFKNAEKYTISATFLETDRYYGSNAKYTPENPHNVGTSSNNSVVSNAAMKNTGIPVMVILFLLISMLGFFVSRK